MGGCVAMDYREGFGVPDMAKDVNEGIQHFIKHAATYKLNSQKIMLFGHSRGGFIVQKLLKWPFLMSKQLLGVVLSNGVKSQEHTPAYILPTLFMSSLND